MDNTKNRVDIIDGLRGFAILIVAWYHIWQQSWLWPRFSIFGFNLNLDFLPRVGFFGVEIFFVISGFCVFYPYARNKLLQTGNIKRLGWKSFFKRRVLKIIPCYYLVLLVMVPLTENFPEHLNKGWYLLRHLLCLNSLSLETFHSHYNGVLWSLSVEIQFYIVFPVLCYLMLRRPIATLLTVCVFASHYRLYVLVDDPFKFSFMFNQLPGTLDLFVGGMFAAYVLVMAQKLLDGQRPPWLAPAGTTISIFAFIALMELFKTEWIFIPVYMPEGASHLQVWQSNVRWIVMLITVLIIIGGYFSYKAWIAIFSNKVMVFLSDISYNLYLWHAFIALTLKYRLKIPAYEIIDGQYPNMYGDTRWQILYTLLVTVVSVLVAAIITYAFERPIAEAGRRRLKI